MIDFPTDEAINEALDKILTESAFQSFINEIGWKILNWLAELFFGLSEIDNLGIIPLIIFGIIILLVVLGVALLLRFALRHRLLKPLPVDEEFCADPLTECMIFYKEGAFEKALVFLFIWYLRLLAKDKFITIEKGKTNFQYELELKQNAYGDIERFRAFKTIFAAIRYGNRSTSRDEFESWHTFCLETERGAI